ncbi:hypothetical protein K1T71_001199 [Dendrolimus kikuchii]|uniref:Uncharacterized protein n=1 Tax=Dendrolimus kikuchii TaxID=765133 RepID=A0ACC1DHV2_9NEOP|nr:hypothetical protein K1T71_001199 [Dendrolimus kikuchii]
MQAVVKIIGYILLLANFASSGVLPVDKCKLEDSECMLNAFQKALPTFIVGIPELRTDVLDVMQMDDVSFDLSGLQFSLKNGQLEGLKNTKFDMASFNTAEKKIIMKFHFDGECKGDYTAGGSIFGLPIKGKGKFGLLFKNLLIDIKINYDLLKKSGKTYIDPKKVDFNYEIIDNAKFDLTNLFDGRKDLSDSMHEALNSQWKSVSVDFGQPIVQTAVKKIFSNVKKFLKAQPLEEIAIFN